ncbi:MAG: thrombospondin type 3 repeat-containing protein [Caldilineales bacterium]|nr:thrombospondin type 3 repeat-containing protein [Caldilineales bacterium]
MKTKYKFFVVSLLMMALVGMTIGSDTVVVASGPTIDFSTFLGGGSIDFGMAIDTDSDGNIYVCGATDSSAFPTTDGAFDESHNGGRDAFITKYDASGNLLASTLVGGSSGGDPEGCFAMVVDAGTGDVYFAGGTNSPDFPATAGAYDTSHNGGSDAFACKINGALDTLTYCTFLGSSGHDVAWGIDIDDDGNAYVVGEARDGFPTTTGTAQPSNGGGRDAFAAKLSVSGGLVWSTFLGGSSVESALDVSVAGNEPIVVGSTDSSDYPTTGGAYDVSHDGGADGFVTRLSASGALVYSTLVGGSSTDILWGVVADEDGQAYTCGYSTSSGYPVTAGAFQPVKAGGQDAVVTVLNGNGSSLVYSSFFGGSGSDGCAGIDLDEYQNVILGGSTGSSDLPTKDPSQAATGGGNDAFAAVLSTTDASLYFATYLGGSSSDDARDVALDEDLNILLTGATRSSNFPTMNAEDATQNGSEDVFVTKLAGFYLPDSDDDGVLDAEDNCPYTYNPGQDDMDDDGIGDACDVDVDGDGIANDDDNCPSTANPDQVDLDGDGIGDVCDPDVDGDGVFNAPDNCPVNPNPDQSDFDNDGLGDICDDDDDDDGFLDGEDVCPFENPGGLDANEDGCIDELADLDELVMSLDLPGGTENALLSKVENAAKSVAKGNYTAASNQLEAFINQVEAQRGKKLTDAEADMLIAYVQNVLATFP